MLVFFKMNADLKFILQAKLFKNLIIHQHEILEMVISVEGNIINVSLGRAAIPGMLMCQNPWV